MQSRRGIIFDLDGTLIDSAEDIISSWERAAISCGLVPIAHDHIRRTLPFGKLAVAKAVVGERSVTLAEQVTERYRAIYRNSWTQKTCVFPGVAEMIEALARHSVRMAVLSNKSHHLTVTMCDHFFPLRPFSRIFGTSREIPEKPSPVGALRICTELGLVPSQCLLIGDSAVDMAAAKNAGISSVLTGWNKANANEDLRQKNFPLVSIPADLVGLFAPQ